MDPTIASVYPVVPGVSDLDLEHFTGNQPPPRTNLVAVLQHWAKVRGDEPAFYFTDGEDGDTDQCLTFRELDAAARNVGGYLQKQGAAGGRVLLVYPPVLDFVIGFFGCLYAGATAVPAFPPRRNRKGQRIHSIARDCQAQLALTNEHVRQQIEADANWVEWESISIIATDGLPQDYSNWSAQGGDVVAWQPSAEHRNDHGRLQSGWRHGWGQLVADLS